MEVESGFKDGEEDDFEDGEEDEEEIHIDESGKNGGLSVMA